MTIRSETLMHVEVSDDMAMSHQRIKVHIRCRKCGETFILRGIRNQKGHVETGFKRCLCDNEDEFDIEPLH